MQQSNEVKSSNVGVRPSNTVGEFFYTTGGENSLTYVICLSYQVDMDVFTGNGVNTTAVGILIQSDLYHHAKPCLPAGHEQFAHT
jgi:hypothetical protein